MCLAHVPAIPGKAAWDATIRIKGGLHVFGWGERLYETVNTDMKGKRAFRERFFMLLHDYEGRWIQRGPFFH